MADPSQRTSSDSSQTGEADDSQEGAVANDDGISRLVFARHVPPEFEQFVLLEFFDFPSSANREESVMWRRILVTDEQVHAEGCAKEASDRAAGKHRSYRGFRDSTAGMVRSKRTQKGHWFRVFRVQDEGEHHLHVQVVVPDGVGYDKKDKADVRQLMNEAFGELAPHTCAGQAA